MKNQQKDKILECFYINHEMPSKIAIKLKVSKPYVTKIIQKDAKYIAEKESRKLRNKEKRAIYKKEYNKRYKKTNEEIEDFIKHQHKQASIELSYEVVHHIID